MVSKETIKEYDKDGKLVRERTIISEGGSEDGLNKTEERLDKMSSRMDKAFKRMDNIFLEINQMFKELF